MKAFLEVKFGHSEGSDDGYGSWTEYETLAFFDDVNLAWEFIKARVAKYQTRHEDYSVVPMVLNPDFKIGASKHEEYQLDSYNKRKQAEIEHQKRIELDQRTVGWKCSLCSMTFKKDKDFQIRRNRHNKWHENALKDKRNTTNGTPEWLRLVKKMNKILNKEKVTVEGEVSDEL